MTRIQNFHKRSTWRFRAFLEFFLKTKWPNLGSVTCNISNWNDFFTELNSKKIFYQIGLFDVLEPFWSFLRTKLANLGSVSCDISNWNIFLAELNNAKIFYKIGLFDILEPFWRFLKDKIGEFGECIVWHIKLKQFFHWIKQ